MTPELAANLSYLHPLLTGAGILIALLSYAGGQQLRKQRKKQNNVDERLRQRHVRISRMPVTLMLLGALFGFLSHIWLSRGPHLQSVHGWAGLLALLLFAGSAGLGIAIFRERSDAKLLHGLIGFLALGTALFAALTGIELLP